MDETNSDWDDLRLFIAVAREGGLAAAASSTRKSAPTLGRRMLSLERRLGRELFRRMARGYELTEDGRDLLARVAELEHQIEPLFETQAHQAVPVVKISAGIWVTRTLCAATPTLIGTDRIKLRFIAADEKVDIGRREALIGIRNERPDGAGLAGRRIGTVSFATYAIDRNVVAWAKVLGATPSARWVQAASAGANAGANAIEVTSPRSALDLALAGSARVVLPTFVGAKQQSLMQVSPPIDDLEHDQWLVTHHEDRFVPVVRTVIDRTYEALRRVLGKT